jgi:hypothetical protein
MRIAAVLLVIVAVAIGAVLVLGNGSNGNAAESSLSAKPALDEIDALQKAEASYYAERGRYSERLADLFATTRFGTDIVMNAGGLDIHLDTSTDGKTVILRVNSPAITLSRVLVRGKETGRTCEAFAAGATCP